MNSKILPIYKIQGLEFWVDIQQHELRQVDQPEHRLDFNDMIDMQSHYTIRLRLPAMEGRNPSKLVQVNIPTMIELDPKGMAEKYGLSQQELQGKTDFQVMVNPRLLAERRAGKLPEIEIIGKYYLVNLERKELHQEQDHTRKINLKNLEFSPDGNSYRCLFDLKHHRPLQDIEVNLPKHQHLVELRIPNELQLDPVYIARTFGMDEQDLLRRFPIQSDLKATHRLLSPQEYLQLKERHQKMASKPSLAAMTQSIKKGRGL